MTSRWQLQLWLRNAKTMSKAKFKSVRSLGLSCGVLALCYGLDIGHENLASESFRIFGVAVYLDRNPPCTTNAVASVTVTVSPFKEQVYIGEIFTALARKAAEVRADPVYAIKLTSFVPNEGAIVTATITTCQQPNLFSRDSSPSLPNSRTS